MKYIEILMRPFPAVRSTAYRTIRRETYHNKMNELKMLIKQKIRIDKIMCILISGNYKITFVFKIQKGKEKLIKEGENHILKPDIDNLYKAFTDSIFYGEIYNDSEIFKINCQKIWGKENKIIFEYND